jgi:hypothetical protein
MLKARESALKTAAIHLVALSVLKIIPVWNATNILPYQTVHVRLLVDWLTVPFVN